MGFSQAVRMGIGQAGYFFVQSLTGNPLIDSVMVFSAEYLVLLVPLTLGYLWLQGRKGRRDMFFSSAAVVAGIGSTYILGLFYYHQPPQFQGFETLLTKELENAFPSQHTAAAFSIVWPLIYQERYRLSAVLLVAAALTGFARVYTGLHFPLDILGGIAASLLGFAAAYILEDRVESLESWFSRLEGFDKVSYS